MLFNPIFFSAGLLSFLLIWLLWDYVFVAGAIIFSIAALVNWVFFFEATKTRKRLGYQG